MFHFSLLLQNKFINLISKRYFIDSQLHLHAFSGKLEGDKRLCSKSTTHFIERKLRHRNRYWHDSSVNKNALPSRMKTSVQSLGPLWGKERTNSHKFFSIFHMQAVACLCVCAYVKTCTHMHTCTTQ